MRKPVSAAPHEVRLPKWRLRKLFRKEYGAAASDEIADMLSGDLDLLKQEKLLAPYAQEGREPTAHGRALLKKLSSGLAACRHASDRIACQPSDPSNEEWNQHYVTSRNSLIYELSGFCADLLPPASETKWLPRLFCMDLDGVFDCADLGFPHTTISGIRSLALLRSHGFSVVVNTGRSVEHVRHYCQTYALPGGLGEYGGVFIDAIRQLETSLISKDALQQLDRARQEIKKLPGVFVDSGFRYSICAYRYSGRVTVGLPRAETEELLKRCRLDTLRCLEGPESTHIIERTAGKGAGLLAVLGRLGVGYEPFACIGDSDEDLPMLRLAEHCYAPSNCSRRIQELAGKLGFRIMDQPFQRGLLRAVQDLLRRDVVIATEAQRH